MTRNVPAPPMLLTRAAVIRAGGDDGRIRRLVADRSLTRVRRGTYVRTDDLAALQRERQHLLAVNAAVAAQDGDVVVSHQSAAVLHGLPVWGYELDLVHLTRARRNAGRRNRIVHVHTAPLGPAEMTTIDGLSVTSPARTVFDVACVVSHEAAVVVADAALNAGLTSPAELIATAREAGRRVGGGSARQALEFADGRSESVGESRSRVLMSRVGVPVPALQTEIRRSDESVAGRPDFRWGRLLGEFDGLVKYGRLLRPGESAGDAVVREKRREDELRDLGFDMVRWGWSDLAHPDALGRRIMVAIMRSEGRS